MRTQRLPCFYHYWYLTIATNPLGLIWWIGIMGLDEIEREINLSVISLSPNQHLWSVWYKLFIKLHPRVVSKALFSRALLPDSADWIYRSLPNNNPLRITPIVKSVKWFFKMNREPWDKKKTVFPRSLSPYSQTFHRVYHTFSFENQFQPQNYSSQIITYNKEPESVGALTKHKICVSFFTCSHSSTFFYNWFL